MQLTIWSGSSAFCSSTAFSNASVAARMASASFSATVVAPLRALSFTAADCLRGGSRASAAVPHEEVVAGGHECVQVGDLVEQVLLAAPAAGVEPARRGVELLELLLPGSLRVGARSDLRRNAGA